MSEPVPEYIHTEFALRRENATLASRVRQLEDDTALLRRLLWLRHGCPTVQLYGDDGEMQCGTCVIDFKRLAPEAIQYVWHCAAVRAAAGEDTP